MKRAVYVIRAEAVVAVAPVAPPCFADRLSWVEYLQSAAEAQRDDGSQGPLLIEPGQPVRFNVKYRYCRDCTAQHSLAMTQAGRCQPDYLLMRLPPDPPRSPSTAPPATAPPRKPRRATEKPQAAEAC